LLADEKIPTIDRKKLGSIVFSDREAMKRLENIIWPQTRDRVLQKISKIQMDWKPNANDNRLPVIVVEAAVLVETGWHDKENGGFLDGLWVVQVPSETAIQRLVENRGLDRDEAIKRIEAQKQRRGIGNLNDEIRQKVVSAVIDNSNDLDELKKCLADKLQDPSAWYL
jgi:dephospho-CoA kinase